MTARRSSSHPPLRQRPHPESRVPAPRGLRAALVLWAVLPSEHRDAQQLCWQETNAEDRPLVRRGAASMGPLQLRVEELTLGAEPGHLSQGRT